MTTHVMCRPPLPPPPRDPSEITVSIRARSHGHPLPGSYPNSRPPGRAGIQHKPWYLHSVCPLGPSYHLGGNPKIHIPRQQPRAHAVSRPKGGRAGPAVLTPNYTGPVASRGTAWTAEGQEHAGLGKTTDHARGECQAGVFVGKHRNASWLS